MKRSMLIFSFVFIALSAHAGGEETLFKSGQKLESGGFGGPVLKLTKFDQELGLLAGGRGSWLINHRYAIGGGVYRTATDLQVSQSRSNHRGEDLSVNYGGFMLGYLLKPNKKIHASINLLLGGGTASYSTVPSDTMIEVNTTDNSFLVAEPELNAELNVTEFLRIGLGISYRHVLGSDLKEIKGSELSGLAASLTFKFGEF